MTNFCLPERNSQKKKDSGHSQQANQETNMT